MFLDLVARSFFVALYLFIIFPETVMFVIFFFSSKASSFLFEVVSIAVLVFDCLKRSSHFLPSQHRDDVLCLPRDL